MTGFTSTPTTDNADEQARNYLRIRPTDDEISAERASTIFRRLHRLGAGEQNSGLLARLFGTSSPPPTVEVLLFAPSADAVTYVVGVDDPAALEGLERHLRQLFGPGDEFEAVDRPLAWLDRSTHDAVAGVEYEGVVQRRRDWQLPLRKVEATDPDEAPAYPLASVAETVANTPAPMVYQALIRPKPDWSAAVDAYRRDLETDDGTLVDVFLDGVLPATEETDHGRPGATPSLSPEARGRLEALEEASPSRSFEVNARAIALPADRTGDGSSPGGPTARAAVRELAGAFGDLGAANYEVRSSVVTGDEAADLRESITDRRFHRPQHGRLRDRLPLVTDASAGIVASPGTAPAFGLLDGNSLATAGARAVDRTPGERTAMPRPPDDRLETYHTEGLTLGRPLSRDDTADDAPVAVPPALQPMHVAWLGKTGAGKTTAAVNALLDNHAATDGATILVEPKGDGMVSEYCRAHFARFGDLDDVLHFDCAELLPAFSFFDVRDDLAAGVDRTTAVEDTVDHYVEILTHLMGAENFNRAVRAPDVIRYLVKAMFDPVNGSDAFSHRELQEAARTMHERESPPPVSDPDLERMLSGLVANRSRTFDEIMAGVANRMEKIPVDRRLARIFNHVPEGDDPQFDLHDCLDDDVVVIFDTSGLRSAAQRALALVVLSNLWTALRRRKQRAPDRSHPLVNLHVEEAASVAVSTLLQELLAQGRGFDCSVTLSMQFPEQLRQADADVYSEVLNNVSTIVTGPVPVDDRLAKRLATEDMPPGDVANRLRALRRGQWLVSLPGPFDEPAPRPFLLESMPLPPGHPDVEQPIAGGSTVGFDDAMADLRERTASQAGVELSPPSAAGGSDGEGGSESAARSRVDSALPHTRRLPPTVTYDAEGHRLRCTECDRRADPTAEGMKRAIDCCGSLADVDRADVPICEVNLKLAAEERAASDYSDRQLQFLQAVYNAQQLRYETTGYSLLRDSMIRLREYVDVDVDAVEDLIDDGLLSVDSTRPHKLYTVTPDGRDVLGESYRRGVDYGHGQGDLDETSQHVLAVEAARRYLREAYAADDDSPVETVTPYYDLDDNRRLDLAGLDEDGDVVVAVEAERINHDTRKAVPADFDKLADCDPEEAIWVVPSRDAAQDVLAALRNPADGDPRVETEYSRNTPPNRFMIDAAGMTDVYTIEFVLGKLELG